MVFKADLAKLRSGTITPENLDEVWLRKMVLFSNGWADLTFFNSEGINYGDAKWTDGYLIRENGEAQTVSEFFTVTLNGVEYLVIENKNGEYTNFGNMSSYFIYTRTGE